MGTHIDEQTPLDLRNAALPSARRALALQGRPARIVRQVAGVPVSLYYWISGPPVTSIEKERATLADASNSRRGATLVI